MHQAHVLAVLDGAADHTAHHDPAHIVIVVQGVDQHLKRSVHIHVRSGDAFDDGAEQRFQVVAFVIHGQLGNALLGGGIDHREIQLVVVGVQFDEQVQDFVHHFFHPLIRTVDFVDDHHRFQMMFQGFPQYVFGLGHGAFISVYQQQYAVHHVQHPFHFAAEVSMARSVQDVDLAAIVHNGSILGQDGDPTFSFLIVGVHDPFLHLLVGPEYTALLQHGIHQGSLTVVDVSDDGNVTQIISNHKSPIPSYFQINQEDACLEASSK